MDSQSISYLSVVWVLYSPLFPVIAFPRWQVDRECFCSWSVHLWSDIRNIFSITAVWNLNACESQGVFILSCAQKRLSKPSASIGALASRTLPTPHHTRDANIYNAPVITNNTGIARARRGVDPKNMGRSHRTRSCVQKQLATRQNCERGDLKKYCYKLNYF